jgi:1,5-anhydro-D-fructose reductase (1,5-anhydro-D-mannitol-forming)
LVAVMRRHGDLAADFARRHRVPRWTTDAEDIIGSDDVDAVYIASHPATHREYVLRCAEAGKPVLVEKPMGLDHVECVEMTTACELAGVPLWVAYYRRALPRFLAVKDLLAEDAIGTVRGVQVRRHEPLPPGDGEDQPWQVAHPELSRGGVFFDGVCHVFDFLDFVFGPVAAAGGEVSNQAGAYSVEDTVAATFRFQSGLVGSGFWCFASDDVRYDRATVFGSRGRLSFSTQFPEPIVLQVGNRTRVIPIDDPPYVHQPLIQTIVDELFGDGNCLSTGLSGARTAWVMDQIMGRLPSAHSTSQPPMG